MGSTVFVRIFDEAGDNVLMVLNKSKSMPDGKPKPKGWGLPGGGMRAGETPLQAIIRELKEETGLEAEIGPEPIFSETRLNHQTIIVFDGKNPRGTLQPLDADIVMAKFVDWRWLEHDNFKVANPNENISYPVYQSHIKYIQQLLFCR